MNELAPIEQQIRTLLDHNPMVGERREGSRRFWTAREEKVLRATYPGGGVPACLPLLPGRSASSIYNHAGLLGLHASGNKPVPRQRWSSTETIDAVIRRTYTETPTKGDVNDLARRLNRPRWWVSKRAAALGLAQPRFKEPAWTGAELDLIAENAHRHPRTLQGMLRKRGFRRTETAITVKLKRVGADRSDPDHFTATSLAGAMGVDAKTVTSWIKKGWLKASRRGTERVAAQGGDEWWVHRRDVRAFVLEHTASVDIRKVEKFWFVDLLARSQ